jgi:hypothetical protein
MNTKTTAQIENELRSNGALLANSGAARALEQLKRARARVAFLKLAAGAPNFGYAVAEDKSSMTRAEAEALATEAMGYLQSLLPAKAVSYEEQMARAEGFKPVG